MRIRGEDRGGHWQEDRGRHMPLPSGSDKPGRRKYLSERAPTLRAWRMDSGDTQRERPETLLRRGYGCWRKCYLDWASRMVPAPREHPSTWAPSRGTFTWHAPVRTQHGGRRQGGDRERRASRAWGETHLRLVLNAPFSGRVPGWVDRMWGPGTKKVSGSAGWLQWAR